jgi:hypothetical protein
MNNYKFKIMKKVFTLFIIILALPLHRISAQNPNIEKLNSYRIGFFTKKLNLTPQEAEKFWPVFNEYQQQKNLIQTEKIGLIRNFNQNEAILNDSQLTEIGDKLIATVVKDSELAVTFHNKLKEVLPPAKVIKFYQAENQYKIQLLNELQKNRQQQAERRRDL